MNGGLPIAASYRGPRIRSGAASKKLAHLQSMGGRAPFTAPRAFSISSGTISTAVIEPCASSKGAAADMKAPSPQLGSITRSDGLRIAHRHR